MKRVINKLFELIQFVESRFLLKETNKQISTNQSLKKGLDDFKFSDEEINPYWVDTIRKVVTFFNNNDSRLFLHCNAIGYTMFANVDYKEFRYLKKNVHWETIKKSLVEDRIGNPKRYLYYFKSSQNLIHHAYSLHFGLENIGVNIENINSVFEFGGGYGSFCRLLYKSNFSGNYTIYDLKIFSLIQQYFLSNVTLNKINFGSYKEGRATINLVYNEPQLLETNSQVDLIVGLWSLSEAPYNLRDKIFSQMRAKYYVIAYSHLFEEYNNSEYFKKMEEKLVNEGYRVINIEIEHLKGHSYFLAAKT